MAANNNVQQGLTRPRYFDRQQLRAEDLTVGQTYVQQRTQRLNRYLRGCGVVCGMELRTETAADGTVTIFVSPGFALSPQGEEIYISEEQKVEACLPGITTSNCDNLEALDELSEQEAFVTVKYSEYQVSPVPAVPQDCDPPQSWENSRICESFELACLKDMPETCASINTIDCRDLSTVLYGPKPCPPPGDDPWVILARLSLDSEGLLLIDYSIRSNIIGGRYLDDIFHCGIAGISSILPVNGKQGENIPTTIHGWGLKDVNYLVFDGSGIDVELVSEQIHTLSHSGRVRDTVFSSDGNYLAGRGDDGTVRIWNLDDGQEVSRVTLPGNVIDISFNPDSSLIAIAQSNGLVRIADVNTGQQQNEMSHGNPITAIVHSPVGPYVVTVGTDSQIIVWRSDTGQFITRVLLDVGIRKVVFTPDGRYLWVLCENNIVRQLDLLTAHQRDIFGIDDSTASIIAFEMSDDCRYLAISDTEGFVRIYSVDQRRFVTIIPGNESILDIAFSPDGQQLATSSGRGFLRIYKMWDATPRIIIDTDGVPYTTIRFSPDGQRIITQTYYLDYAWVWDVSSGQIVTTLDHENRIDGIAFSPVRRQLVTCGMGDHVRIWRVQSGAGDSLAVNIKIDRDAGVGQRELRIFRNEGVLDSSSTQVAFNVQLAEPLVTRIYPDNGSPGNTVTISISGRYLAGSSQLVFPGGGISASIINAHFDNTIYARLRISHNAALGNRRFEIMTPRGIIRSVDQEIYFRVWSMYYGSGAYSGGWDVAIGGGLL